MSTAAVSTASQASLYTEKQEYFKTRQSDLQQLGKDLASGNTSAAATEYQDIVQLGKSGPFASGDAFSRTDRQSDFTAIGQALQSGDLAGAQQAFSDLKATFAKAVPVAAPGANPIDYPVPAQTGEPASSGSSGSNNGPEIVLNIGASSTPEQINITIGNSSSGGEQISIGVGAQGSSAQQVTTLNLPANSDEQIVLNLAGATATSSDSTTSAATGSGLSVSA